MNNACDGWRFTQIRGSLGGGRRDVGASEPERRGLDGLDGLDEPPGAWVDGWMAWGGGGKGGGRFEGAGGAYLDGTGTRLCQGPKERRARASRLAW